MPPHLDLPADTSSPSFFDWFAAARRDPHAIPGHLVVVTPSHPQPRIAAGVPTAGQWTAAPRTEPDNLVLEVAESMSGVGRVQFGPYQLKPGLIDDEAVEAFTAGYCGLLAAELCRRTGWEMWWLTVPSEVGEDDLFDCDYTLHFVAVTPDGIAVDINGPQPIDYLMDEWEAQGRPLSGGELAEALGVIHGRFAPEGDPTSTTKCVDAFADTLLHQFDRRVR